MTSLVFLLIALFLGGILFILIKAVREPERGRNKGKIPVKAKPLLSHSELNLYHVIRSIIPDGKAIFCKCRLEDFITVEKCRGKASYRNKIKSRHVDFVIFDPDNGKIDYAIELDDRSHNSEKARETDRLKDELFEKIGIPLIRITAKRIYDPTEIRKILGEAASGSAVPPPGKAPPGPLPFFRLKKH